MGGGDYSAHAVRALLVALAVHNAYQIRTFAIRIYGMVIHEFDPWFNFRATEYLATHGWREFFRWFDHRAWYPLGRPVGTTIYPGMQITSVAIWRLLNEVVGVKMSLNDVCVFVPVWFGVSATLLLGLLTYECSRSANAAVAACMIMAVIPAHLMRSVGGGYDNESVAMTTMCLSFWLWCRSLRTRDSWPIGALAGAAYIYMAATWGGFVFVLNIIGAHAALLVLLGRYSSSLHRAYSLWYVIGTFGATRVPVVGSAPLRSLEQLAPGALFLGLQLIEASEVLRRRRKLTGLPAWKLRAQIFGAAALAGLAACSALFSTGYFGPISARVRGLFVKHTRTGNPLVDSVAEHQPASSNAYWHYLHYTTYAAPLGLALCLVDRTDAKFFVALYACFAYFFSSKMVRLIIFLGPVASALSGVALGLAVDATAPPLVDALLGVATGRAEPPRATKAPPPAATGGKKAKKAASGGGGGGGGGKKNGTSDDDKILEQAVAESRKKAGLGRGASARKGKAHGGGGKLPVVGGLVRSVEVGLEVLRDTVDAAAEAARSPRLRLARTVVAAAALAAVVHYYKQFSDYAWSLAEGMSQPSIMFRAHLRDGTPVMVNDYREAYHWLRDNTPEDARVMAWWDYGYQINGIANRTTIADGNTWNHEHIATLGRCLTSPEKQAHRIVRHLADYVLVWTGGGGDDLAKSPHMARIGNSVFRDICPNDPTCARFGFVDRHGTPTPMMAESLLYKLHAHNQRPGVRADPALFREVYTSRFNKVRIYKVMRVSKKSKKWVADPANRVCDAPGSWYCVGQYPPALAPLIERRINFAQLEDFNKKRDEGSNRYVDSYMKRMEGKSSSDADFFDAPRDYFEIPDDYEEEDEDEDDEDDEAFEDYDHEADAAAAERQSERAQKARQAEWAQWTNNEDTTHMWSIVSSGSLDDLAAWIKYAPSVVHMRSKDGRGPLWWAFEYDQPEMVQFLVANGADEAATDSLGMTPEEMAP